MGFLGHVALRKASLWDGLPAGVSPVFGLRAF